VAKKKTTDVERLESALGQLEQLIRQECMEFKVGPDAVEMAAYDAGYQRHPRLPAWLIYLGDHFGVDVASEYIKGLEDAPEPRS
jgi:hypothetical protein